MFTSLDSLLSMQDPDSQIRLQDCLQHSHRREVFSLANRCSRHLEVLEDYHTNTLACFYADISVSGKATCARVTRIKETLHCFDIETRNLAATGSKLSNSRLQSAGAQSKKAKVSEPLVPRISKPAHHHVQKKLQQSKYMRHFSSSLYHALEQSCREHQRHQAYFRLQPHDTVSIGQDSFIEMKLRFSKYYGNHWGIGAPPSVWLAIQSSIAGAPRPMGRDTSPAPPDTTSGSTFYSNHDDERYRRRNSEHCSPSEKTSSKSALGTNNQRSTTYDSNLSARGKFCKLMHRHSQETAEDPGLYLGYIESNTTERYRVHFNDAFLTFGRSNPISLEEAFARYFAGGNANSMPYERVELAKQVASAMLHFQGTPLLPPTWTAADIVFFGKPQDRLQAEDIFRGPHLNVCISSPSSTDSGTPITENDEDVQDRFMVDLGLFRLAVILIEIAYQKPISELLSTESSRDHSIWDKLAGDGKLRPEAYDTHQWETINGLCDGVTAQLGVTYHAVVSKCLEKSLNQGTKGPNGEDHDILMYTEVVNELEQLKVWMINEDDD